MSSAPRTPYERHTAGQPPEKPLNTDKGSPNPTHRLCAEPRQPHKRAPLRHARAEEHNREKSYNPHAKTQASPTTLAPQTAPKKNGKRKPEPKRAEPQDIPERTHRKATARAQKHAPHQPRQHNPSEKGGTPRKTHTAHKMKPECKHARKPKENPERSSSPHANTHTSLTTPAPKSTIPKRTLQNPETPHARKPRDIPLKSDKPHVKTHTSPAHASAQNDTPPDNPQKDQGSPNPTNSAGLSGWDERAFVAGNQ